MRRTLMLATFLLVAPPPAAAQWGETAVVEQDVRNVATCLRDAGGGRIAALAQRSRRFGATLYRVADERLQPEGEVLMGRSLEDCPAVAVADSGAAAIAASVWRGAERPPRPPRLMVAVRDAGSGFAAPVEVTQLVREEAGIRPAVAVAPDGTVIVAWQESYDAVGPGEERLTVRVARRPPGGRFGPAQTLVDRARGDDSLGVGLAIGVDAAGDVTLAWARPRPAQRHGTLTGLSSIEVAVAAPGAPFGAPRIVAPDVQDVGAIALAVAPDGRSLLVHDGAGGVRTYERTPGAAAFVQGPTFGSGQYLGRPHPAVALAPDGGAVVAWRAGGAVVAVTRAGAGAFGSVTPLLRRTGDAGSGFQLFAVYASTGAPVDADSERLRAVAAPGGQAVVGWLVPGAVPGAAVSARVALTNATGLVPAAALGSPSRDVGSVLPWLGAGGPAAIWTDNRTGAVGAEFPVSHGRLHLARAGRPPAAPPPPAVTLTAAPQRLFHGDPLMVRARCAAACDLRATIAPRPSRGEADYDDGGPPAAAVGTGGRRSAGPVRLRVEPWFSNHIAPFHGRSVRVVVRASAPGGTDASRTVLRVRVRRRPVPPLQVPLDVRAARAGDDVIVTWRTAGPAQRMTFRAYTRRTRKAPVDRTTYGELRGHGHRRFRLRLQGARAMRWLVLFAVANDPPPRSTRVVVPIG
jgi:hypothetical protein